MKFRTVLTILIGFGLSAKAAPVAHADPLKFKAWKEQQIVEAQNEVLRISARLRSQKMAKSEKTASPDTEVLSSNRFQRLGPTPDLTDRDLKMAQESLEIAKEFGLQDYADVYVSSLQDDPDQFSKLMSSLSRDEMAQLMKILVKNKTGEQEKADRSPPGNAVRNRATAPAPFISSPSHS